MNIKVIVAVLGVSAVASAQDREVNGRVVAHSTAAVEPVVIPGAQQPTMSQLMQRSGGSLIQTSMGLGRGRAELSQVSFMYVAKPEPRTMKKHDQIVIIVRELSEIKSDGSTDLKKDADVDMRIEEMIKLSGGLKGGGVEPPIPSIKMSGKRNFKGEASTDRNDSFTARISATVVDVKPNGTFVIEEQEYLLTGTCRAEDVTPDNSVYSWQIASMDVQTRHKGAVRDTTKRGWVPKLLDFVNPF
jgi:flagellar L-ring protein FlgH